MLQNNSLQLAKLFIALEETRARIWNEILPLCAHLAPEELAEVAQSLELAASTIDQHFAKYRLVAEESRQLFGDDERERYGI